MTEDDFTYAISYCLECHLAPLSLTSLRTRHSSIPNEQYETESGAEGAGTGRLRLHGIGRSIMFSLSINHIINKGKDGAWLSGRRTTPASLLKAAHVPDHLRTQCFPARLVGSTCHFLVILESRQNN